MRPTLLRQLPILLLFTILVPSILAQPAAADAADLDRWTPIGPDGGMIRSLAADPDAPGTLYAGIIGGGVWKSLDGGATWAPTPEGLGYTDISTLAVSAGRVFAGTYTGIYVLTEGAARWRRVGSPRFEARKLAVDPTHPGRIWAIGFVSSRNSREVLVSEDGGEHWRARLRLSHDLQDIAVAPTVPPTVYVAADEGLFASTDGGAAWRQFTSGFDDPESAPYSAAALAVDPLDAETLYLTAYNSFWRTTDAGAHWSRSTASESPGYLLAAPPGALLGVSAGVVRSEDGGDTWHRVRPLPRWSFYSIAADPTTPGGAWLGGDGFSTEGLLHTADGGLTWEQIGRGLRTSNVRTFALDPFLPGTLYAVTTAAARLQKSVDAGASWSPAPTRLEIHSLAADPRRPGTLYAGTPRGVFVSQDRGAQWQPVLQEPQGIEVVVVDPRRPGTIWAAGRRVWNSRDGGVTWRQVASPIGPGSAATAWKIFLSPGHPETLYFLDAYLTLSRSTDGGATWERIGKGFSPVALAFDSAADLLYMADGFGTIRKSRDGGTTWKDVAHSIARGWYLTALLIDPRDPSVLYVGTTGDGVWRSLDKGVTWHPFSAGIIAPVITCLEADPRNPRHLVACAQGGGLLEIQISGS